MIIIPDHARQKMEARGVSDEEVEQVVESGQLSEAREPRVGKDMVFTRGYIWKSRHYAHKRVRAIFVYDGEDIVIVTIYSYYGRWEV